MKKKIICFILVMLGSVFRHNYVNDYDYSYR